MKAFNLIKSVLLLALVATITMRCSCNENKPAATPTQKLAAKIWKVQVARKNGSPVSSADFSTNKFGDMRLKFTAATPNTYSFERNGSTVSPSRKASQTGTWTLDGANTTLTLDSSTDLRTITLANLTDNSFTMTFKLGVDEDKTTPEISFDLVPAQ